MAINASNMTNEIKLRLMIELALLFIPILPSVFKSKIAIRVLSSYF